MRETIYQKNDDVNTTTDGHFTRRQENGKATKMENSNECKIVNGICIYCWQMEQGEKARVCKALVKPPSSQSQTPK
jgi:hypothetical protein